ncbi:MAG TPA: hypothetical protein VFC53_10375 [Dehalococcoidia bacterium]|jgi:hypothetical protein|nr:hypothetical protein [Dehalococcoidia bacterium]
MPRGVYDRSKARRRRATSSSISTRLEKLGQELAALTAEVRQAEGLKAAVDQYMRAGATDGAAPRRRGRPPGSGTGRRGRPPGSGTARRGRPPGSGTRRRGRPPKVAATASAAPRRRGRPPKNPQPAA